MEKRSSSYSTCFLVPKLTISCSRSMNGFDKVKEKMDKTLLQKPVLIEFSQWVWWTKFRFLRRNRKEVKRNFCKTREVRAWIRHVHWFRIGKDLQLWRVSRWPKRKIVWTGKASCGIVSRTEASTLEEDVSISRQENWRKEVQTCISTPMIHL